MGKDKIVVERVSEKFTILCKKYTLLILCTFGGLLLLSLFVCFFLQMPPFM